MWLQNVSNGRYFPYSEFLEKHTSMIRVYNNPFKIEEDKLKKETIEDANERLYDSFSDDDCSTITEIIEKQNKSASKKGRPKK